MTITKLLEGNRRFVAETFAREKEFFAELARGQRPTVLWIGCSDSRVPVNIITGTHAGEVLCTACGKRPPGRSGG